MQLQDMVISDPQCAECSNIYVIVKTTCPPIYHRTRLVASHELEHMMCGYLVPKCMSCYKTIVMITRR